jgi:hypothetical protein
MQYVYGPGVWENKALGQRAEIQIGYMKWQPSLMFQVVNSYFISLAGYGM